MISKITVLILLTLSSLSIQAQSILQPGNAFYIRSTRTALGATAVNNPINYSAMYPNDIYLSIQITSEEPACINVWSPEDKLITRFNMQGRSSKNLLLPATFIPHDSIRFNAMRIESDKPINVYYTHEIADSTHYTWVHNIEMTMMFPILSDTYSEKIFLYSFGREQEWFNTVNGYYLTEAEIVSHEDENSLFVCFSAPTMHSPTCRFYPDMMSWCVSNPKDTCISIVLNKHERIAYQMVSCAVDDPEGDPRLSSIESVNNRSFDVYTKAQNPYSSWNYTQNPPTGYLPGFHSSSVLPPRFWSSKYYIPPRPEYPFFNVMCFSPDTINYQIQGNTFQQHIVDTSFAMQDMVIEADEPFALLTGTESRPRDSLNQNEQVFISYPIVGTEHYYKRACFAPFSFIDDPNNHYVVSIVVPTSGVNGMRHNGSQINPSIFTPFSDDPTYSWGNLEIDTGYQCFEGDSAFLAIHYSWYRDHTINNHQGSRVSYSAVAFVLSATPFVETTENDTFYIKAPNGSKIPFSDFDSQVGICPGDSVWIYPARAAYTRWEIHKGDGQSHSLITNHNEIDSIRFSYDEPGYYTIVVEDQTKCKNGDFVKIYVREMDEFSPDIALIPFCENYYLKISLEESRIDSIQWSLPDGQLIHLQSVATEIPIIPLPFSIFLTVWIEGCEYEEEFVINESALMDWEGKIPNIFTPNNDGVNDCWEIPNTESYEQCFQLYVSNRWGQQVYYSTDPWDCWDGKASNGRDLAQGTYFYSIKMGAQELRGNIQLMR